MSEQLTPSQLAAVEHFEGPLMVLAGPGSGKTRVITYRIARLLQQGVAPDEILALTFTNKAAREMSERVHRLLGGLQVQVSTFHRFCAKLLRRFPDQVGLKNNFTILDSSDQVQLVRRIMKDIGFDAMSLDPRRVLNRISKARNDLITAEQFRLNYEDRVGDPIDAVVYEVFPEYELQILHQNSVDFDALLLHVVNMLSDNEELREFLDRSFRFVLVDEYQDTNLAQYRIVLALSQIFPNLCATGDPDQSIYGWRGARPENIVQFEQDFPNTKIVSLDQNFRSTAAIVRNADQLISKNPRRHRSPLFTENEEGETVKLRIFSDAEDEANSIAREIAEQVQSGKRMSSDFAVFYRVNALSRSVETALSRHAVPFQVAAGYSFFERAEIRDLVGYLRLIENPADDVAFLRIINRPARGLGDRTIERVAKFAQQHGLSLLDSARRHKDVPSLTKRSQTPLKAFAELIESLSEYAQSGNVHKVIERLISEINYMSLWKDENDEVDQDRRANVHELINAARLYEDAELDPDNSPSLQGFLEMSSLTSEADSVDASNGAVTLMTMHAAKGLEFPVVYIIGVENGFIPHDRAVQNGDPASFQEERRLLFVGVTRAMQELNLTQTRQRDFRGSRRYTISSPFLPEMDLEVVCEDNELPPPIHKSPVNDHVEKARLRYESSQKRTGDPLIMSAADLEKKLAAAMPQSSTAMPVAPTARSDSTSRSAVPAAESSVLAETRSALQTLMQRKAAETSNAAASGSSSPQQFATGTQVRHPRYGRGVVLDASDGSSRATVTVLFEVDDRQETFVAAHCPLQPIGGPRPK